MSLDSMIARTRARQNTLWRDTCTVDRSTGAESFNETTGDTTFTTEQVYDGNCQVRPIAALSGLDVEVGEQELRIVRVQVKFPAETDIRKDDLITVTASTYDPALAGRTFRVTDVPANGWQVARVCIVEEVT
jgi:hypothetical protein